MSEKKPETKKDGLEVTYRIPVERFQYEDELLVENRKLRTRTNRQKIWLIALPLAALLIGWCFSAFVPTPFSNQIRQGVTFVTQQNADTKLGNIQQVMQNYWYFAKDIENLGERLTDQAAVGMTTNEEDPHTQYMSKEEIESFTQSINRNFVGIGVQFQSQDNGLNLITRVFRDSPAERAGVQAGDIIHSVDGTVVDNMSATEIKELVQGEIGTDVTMVFLREGEYITLDITRGEIGHTVDGDITEEGFGLIHLEQFGETTASEVDSYLAEFADNGVTGLIIDLRDNGGGYLEALQGVISKFLPANMIFIQRDYANGIENNSKTSGGMYEAFSPIVILVNENTASASEAFTMALKEQRDDVTIVGETTYGKGSVRITQYYKDGSALKYTDSIWKSPKGVWINGVGIEPDETVSLHPVLSTFYESMEEGDSYAFDSVSTFVAEAQQCLDFLGYKPGRTDGYFDRATETSLHAFQKEAGQEETGILDQSVYEALVSAVVRKWSTDKTCDTQYQKAIEILSSAQADPAGTPDSDEKPSAAINGNVILFEETVQTLRTEEIGYGTL